MDENENPIEPETVNPPAEPTPAPEPEPSAEDRLKALQAELAEAKHQLKLLDDSAAEGEALSRDETQKRLAHKAAKEALAEWTDRDLNLRRRLRDGQRSLPFGDEPDEPDETEGPEAAAPEPVEDLSWREVSITELYLPPGVEKALIEAELDTVGKLADWSEQEKRLTDIPGIGEAKAERIESALEAFWCIQKNVSDLDKTTPVSGFIAELDRELADAVAAVEADPTTNPLHASEPDIEPAA